MTTISDIALNVSKHENGLWVSNTQRDISYPAEGNQTYFQIEENSFWFNHRNTVIKTVINAYPATGTIFDIGGGNGYVALKLQAAGLNTCLVEPGPQGAINALSRGVEHVIQSSFEDAGFLPDSMPAIGLFDVLEHIEDDANFLDSLHSKLQKDGTIYISVPALNWLWSFDDVDAGHYRRYTKKTLCTKLEQAGFEVEYCNYFFNFLVPAVLLFRCIPSWFNRRKAITPEMTEGEHKTPTGIVGAVLSFLMRNDLQKIKMNRNTIFGTSCILAARKR